MDFCPVMPAPHRQIYSGTPQGGPTHTLKTTALKYTWFPSEIPACPQEPVCKRWWPLLDASAAPEIVQLQRASLQLRYTKPEKDRWMLVYARYFLCKGTVCVLFLLFFQIFSPSMMTEVVPSPTSSSCVRLISIMDLAAGCCTWICCHEEVGS